MIRTLLEADVLHKLHAVVSTALALVLGAALAAGGTGHEVFAAIKSDPDELLVFKMLAGVFVGGCIVHAGVLFANSDEKRYSWRRWVGETLLGGVAAVFSAGAYYASQKEVTLIGMGLAGLGGGFVGQRGIVWALTLWARMRGLMAAGTPPTPPRNGGDGGVG